MHRLKKIRPFYSTNTFGLESAADLAKNGERFKSGHQKQGDLSVTFGRSAAQKACYCLQRESNMNDSSHPVLKQHLTGQRRLNSPCFWVQSPDAQNGNM